MMPTATLTLSQPHRYVTPFAGIADAVISFCCSRATTPDLFQIGGTAKEDKGDRSSHWAFVYGSQR